MDADQLAILQFLQRQHRPCSSSRVASRVGLSTPATANVLLALQKNYLQVTDKHFKAAVSADEKAVRFAVRAGGAGRHMEHAEVTSNRTEAHQGDPNNTLLTPTGFEPVFSG